MRFAPTEDQLALRDAVIDVLTRECPPSVVRAAADDNPSAARGLWSTLAEMGVLDSLASEASGGMGFELSDIVPLARAAGMSALPLPFVEHVFLAAPSLGALGDTVVTATDNALLPYATIADRALLSRAGGLSEVEPQTFHSFPDRDSVDRARPLARVPEHAHSNATPLAAPATALAGATLGTAAMLVGLAQQMLNMTVEYVKDRKQFGVPIGTFQAVKHHLANVRIAIEFADPMIAAAAWSVDNDQPDAPMLTAMAKLRANATAQLAATTCLQCHGAIGYSYEHDLGLWMKRAWALTEAWGTTTAMQQAAGAALGLTAPR